MLIQAFCHQSEQVARSSKMIWNEFRTELDFVELSYMRNIKEGYYNITPYESLDTALANLDMNPEDNVGVYYNEGRKIYIRVFRNAKNDAEAYA